MFVFILCKYKQEHKTVFFTFFNRKPFRNILFVFVFLCFGEGELSYFVFVLVCVFFRRQPFVHFVGLRSPTGRVTGSLRKGCTSENAASSLENSQTFFTVLSVGRFP